MLLLSRHLGTSPITPSPSYSELYSTDGPTLHPSFWREQCESWFTTRQNTPPPPRLTHRACRPSRSLGACTWRRARTRRGTYLHSPARSLFSKKLSDVHATRATETQNVSAHSAVRRRGRVRYRRAAPMAPAAEVSRPPHSQPRTNQKQQQKQGSLLLCSNSFPFPGSA